MKPNKTKLRKIVGIGLFIIFALAIIYQLLGKIFFWSLISLGIVGFIFYIVYRFDKGKTFFLFPTSLNKEFKQERSLRHQHQIYTFTKQELLEAFELEELNITAISYDDDLDKLIIQEGVQ